jgi:hypothetical protein
MENPTTINRSSYTLSGISNDVRTGAHQFRVKINIKSGSASKEQIDELREIEKKNCKAND